ncbi:acyltransferase family protein [Desulforamulus aquiferis]|uniref:Acyltransferase n=1 Tax=Desulforamulus aquiferis TaxID=1397668 RepID=A0AAW7ZBW5_9FIRM|nr:acyltransferase [Desulforamulus aquiferis]MDO7786778.1 acyltransferase [Desulforamulus aquiferis]
MIDNRDISLIRHENKFLLNLQIFRGLAAVMVLVCHANLIVDKDLFNGLLVVGRCGVDFFFVLSGFIIYYANYSIIGNPAQFNKYIRRRFNRIYPIYWVYTLMTIAVHFVLLHFTGKGLIYWISINLDNILRTFSLYPVNTAILEAPIIPVAWTLTYEILFYFMFSLLILLKPKLAIPILSIWAAAVTLNLFLPLNSDILLIDVILGIKNMEFFMGCLAAHLFIRQYFKLPRYLLRLSITLGVILFVISCWYNVATGYILDYMHKTHIITFGVPFFIIILFTTMLEEQFPSPTGKIKGLLLYLGNASYSIYLTHFVILALMNITLLKLYGLDSLAIFIISSLSSLIIGCLSYSFIEKPLLAWLNKNTIKVKPISISN